jgi:hypothetical protein
LASTASAAGQLEQPSEVNNSTTAKPLFAGNTFIGSLPLQAAQNTSKQKSPDANDLNVLIKMVCKIYVQHPGTDGKEILKQ